MEYSIVYLSSSRILIDEIELNKIIETSRSNNTLSNITGALLYCNGNIIQVLEDEKHVVTSLFEKIRRDSRHYQIIPLFQGDIEYRSFSKWAMGYTNTTSRNMKELIDQLPFIDNPNLPTTSSNKVLILLQNFFRNNHRN